MHPAKMTFQAIRIHINREFEELKRGMTSALKCLKPGGKLGIITWKHSECAIVVDYFRHHEVTRADYPLLQWYRSAQKALKSGDRSLEPTFMRPADVAASNRVVLNDDNDEEDGGGVSKDADAGDASDSSDEDDEDAGDDSNHKKKRRRGGKGRRKTKRMAERERFKIEKRMQRRLPRGWGYSMEDVSRCVVVVVGYLVVGYLVACWHASKHVMLCYSCSMFGDASFDN